MPLPAFTEDKIVYQVVTKGGGVDGRDSNHKAGIVTFAAFNRPSAEKAMDNSKEITLTAFSAAELDLMQKEALAKLTGLEKLLLGIENDTVFKRAFH